MLATKAREIMENGIETRHQAYLNRHEKYAKKLTNKRVRIRAEKGYNNTTVCIPRRYNPLTIADYLHNLGYDTVKIKKRHLKIMWLDK